MKAHKLFFCLPWMSLDVFFFVGIAKNANVLEEKTLIENLRNKNEWLAQWTRLIFDQIYIVRWQPKITYENPPTTKKA